MEVTVLTRSQYGNCLGLPRNRISPETMENHLGFSSCLATLKFHHSITSLKLCDTEKVAQNLGYGIGLITSASSEFTLSEIGMDKTKMIDKPIFPHNCCIIGLFTLKCGHT